MFLCSRSGSRSGTETITMSARLVGLTTRPRSKPKGFEVSTVSTGSTRSMSESPADAIPKYRSSVPLDRPAYPNTPAKIARETQRTATRTEGMAAPPRATGLCPAIVMKSKGRARFEVLEFSDLPRGRPWSKSASTGLLLTAAVQPKGSTGRAVQQAWSGNIHAPGTRELRSFGEEPAPRATRDRGRFVHDGRLIERQHAAVAHQPASVDHHRLDVTRLALVHERRYLAQRRREMRSPEVDEDEIGALARRQPAAIGDAEGAIAVARGPAKRALGRGLATVLPAHALHEQRRSHHLHHVLRHVVGAERDEAARALQLVDVRGQTATRGDGGVHGDGHAGGTERALFLGGHAAAVRGHQTLGEKTLAREIVGRQQRVPLLHGGDLAPHLVQVHAGDDIELVLQLSQPAQERGRAHVGRPGGEADRHAAAVGAVPARVQRANALDGVIPEPRVLLERPRLPDRGVGPVPRALAEHQPQTGVDEPAGVALEPVT